MTEYGVGAVAGMTYPIGPVLLLGEFGLDRAYETFLFVTRFGVGYGF